MGLMFFCMTVHLFSDIPRLYAYEIASSYTCISCVAVYKTLFPGSVSNLIFLLIESLFLNDTFVYSLTQCSVYSTRDTVLLELLVVSTVIPYLLL